MVALARLPDGAYAGAGKIATEIGAPQNYLGKILQTLATAGLVTSQKGLGGGFRLAREAQHISLFDVVDPLEHLSRWAGCILGRPECSEVEPCAIHNRWKKVRQAYLDMLTQTTIANLVAKGEAAFSLL
jgi:Rrf2 family protein